MGELEKEIDQKNARIAELEKATKTQDNVVYMEFSNLSIELYTDEKDPELEDRVEAVLNDHELFWNKSEVWIESEKLYEVLYQMTV